MSGPRLGSLKESICDYRTIGGATEPYLQKRFLDSLEEAVGCDVSSEFKGRNCIFPLLMGR